MNKDYPGREEAESQYYDALMKHKACVFEAGVQLGGIPRMQLVRHDESKFMAEEFYPYARHFYGDKGDEPGFTLAVLRHFNLNKHHGPYWVVEGRMKSKPGGADIENGCLEMPMVYVREMVADQLGVNMAYEDTWDMSKWLAKSLAGLKFHPRTFEAYFTILVAELGYTPSDIEKWRKGEP